MTRLPPTLMFILISLPRWGSLIFLRWLGEASVAFVHELLAGGWILPAAHATVTVKGQGQNCIFFFKQARTGGFPPADVQCSRHLDFALLSCGVGSSQPEYSGHRRRASLWCSEAHGHRRAVAALTLWTASALPRLVTF